MPNEIIGSLAELLEKHFGVRTTHRTNPAHANPIVDAVQPVLGANPKRLGFVIVNMGANAVWIAERDSVAADYGFELVPNGGTLNMVWDEDFEMVALPYYALSVAAPGTDIFVMEVMIF